LVLFGQLILEDPHRLKSLYPGRYQYLPVMWLLKNEKSRLMFDSGAEAIASDQYLPHRE